MSIFFDELSALDALQKSGIPTEMYKGKSWDSVVRLLESAGKVKLSNGLWTSGELLTSLPATSAGTALATTTNVGAVEVLTGDAVLAADGSVVAYLGGSGAAAATVGETTAAAGAITLTPKTAIIIAVAAACGLALAYDTGQWIGSEFFDGADFDWSKDSIGGKVITLLTGDGKTYIDEDLANRVKDRLIEIGAFTDDVVVPINPNIDNNLSKKLSEFNRIPLGALINQLPGEFIGDALALIANYSSVLDINDSNHIYYVAAGYYNTDFKQVHICKSDRLDYILYSSVVMGDNYDTQDVINSTIVTSINGYKRLFLKSPLNLTEYSISNGEFYSNTSNGIIGDVYSDPNDFSLGFSPYSFCLGTNIADLKEEEGIPGVKKQPNATYPSSNPLSQTYPSWVGTGTKIFAGDDNDVNKKINMIPISIPADGEFSKPQSDAQTGTNSEESIQEQIKSQDEVSQETNLDPSIKIPTNDTGDSPISPIPAVGIPGTGFVAIYNPTQSQLASFSQYLWSNDFIDNIKKLFEDPMQAIIGLHMIYATPSRGADHNIICGYLDSGVNSRTVSNQYINIACGAIKVNKYFGNILDYAPYTKIQLFLPFIGVVNLDTNEVMGSTLNVTYRVDVLTGACLAQISVSRSDYGAVMYTFSGNCAVQLPITGGNYSSIIANTIGIGASIGATIASGGALAPVAVSGVAAGVSNSHLNVAHSGSIGANAGAMGGKIPYLIITRPKPYNANNYNNFYGYPSNEVVKLSSCLGYTRVKDIHLENISSATDDELNEIESLLKDGVII